MDEPIDRAMQALRAERPDPALAHLESAVWRRIEVVRQARDASAAFLPVRAAAVVAALGIGVATGGVAAGEARAERHEVSVFSVDTGLAPSTLLEGR